jgi:hypothetical protein
MLLDRFDMRGRPARVTGGAQRVRRALCEAIGKCAGGFDDLPGIDGATALQAQGGDAHSPVACQNG